MVGSRAGSVRWESFRAGSAKAVMSAVGSERAVRALVSREVRGNLINLAHLRTHDPAARAKRFSVAEKRFPRSHQDMQLITSPCAKSTPALAGSSTKAATLSIVPAIATSPGRERSPAMPTRNFEFPQAEQLLRGLLDRKAANGDY